MNDKFVLSIRVETSEGFIKEEEIDLTDKIRKRILDTSSSQPYTSNEPEQLNTGNLAISGGQLFPVQSVEKHGNTHEAQVSLNLQIRYDQNDPTQKRWNIDVYCDVHQEGVDNKRILTHRPQDVHKIPDSESIEIEWSINDIKQPKIKMFRPSDCSE